MEEQLELPSVLLGRSNGPVGDRVDMLDLLESLVVEGGQLKSRRSSLKQEGGSAYEY